MLFGLCISGYFDVFNLFFLGLYSFPGAESVDDCRICTQIKNQTPAMTIRPKSSVFLLCRNEGPND